MPDGEELSDAFGGIESVPWDSIIELTVQGSVSCLLNGIGHELNNCLTPVLGYSQLLQEGGLTEAQYRTYAQRIANGAEEISRVVATMLVLTRRRYVGAELINVNDLIKETLALQKYDLDKYGIALELDLARDLPPTVVNAYQIQVVCLSIIQNAVQALANSERARTLTVRTDFLSANAGRLRAEFTDNGPGMPPHVLAHAFDPFFTTKTEPIPPAVGLGLTVCRYLVSRHRGTISIESHPGFGTQVRLELPIIADLSEALMSCD